MTREPRDGDRGGVATARRGMAVSATLACLATGVAAYFAWDRRRADADFAEANSGRILAEVRLAHYVELADEKTARLARLEGERGKVGEALALCSEICPSRRTSYCDSLSGVNASQGDKGTPRSIVHAAVCESLGKP